MVLVGGAGEEVAGRGGEGQQHQQEEAGERAPVPRPGARRQRAPAPRRRLGAAAASPPAAAAPLRPRPRVGARPRLRAARPPRPARGVGIGRGGGGRVVGATARRSGRGVRSVFRGWRHRPSHRPLGRQAASAAGRRGLSSPRPRVYRWRRTKANPGGAGREEPRCRPRRSPAPRRGDPAAGPARPAAAPAAAGDRGAGAARHGHAQRPLGRRLPLGDPRSRSAARCCSRSPSA